MANKIASAIAVLALVTGAFTGYLAEGVLGAIAIAVLGRLAGMVPMAAPVKESVGGTTSYVDELQEARGEWLHKASARAFYAHERDIPAYTVTSNMPVAREDALHGDDDMFRDLQGNQV